VKTVVSVPYVRDVRWDGEMTKNETLKSFSPLRKGCPLGLWLHDGMHVSVSVPYVRDGRWDFFCGSWLVAGLCFSPLRKGCPLGRT